MIDWLFKLIGLDTAPAVRNVNECQAKALAQVAQIGVRAEDAARLLIPIAKLESF
jgi:hypothetical protein